MLCRCVEEAGIGERDDEQRAATKHSMKVSGVGTFCPGRFCACLCYVEFGAWELLLRSVCAVIWLVKLLLSLQCNSICKELRNQCCQLASVKVLIVSLWSCHWVDYEGLSQLRVYYS